MTEDRDTPAESTEPPAEPAQPTEPAAPTFGSMANALFSRAKAGAQQALDAVEQRRPAAERMAREAFERAQHAVDAARPEVERLARDAAAAAQSAAAFARPVVERVAHDAVDYARDHQDELRRAATSAADAAANLATQRIVPGPLRPMVDALRQELQNDEPPADAVPREPESPTAETHLDDGAAQPPPAAQR